MSVSIEHAEKIQQLVGEGKKIVSVWENDFPQYEYWEVYNAAWAGDERSALGVKRMISNRLKSLETASPSERDQYIEEVDDLVWRLYESLKSNQRKLEAIRNALDGK